VYLLGTLTFRSLGSQSQRSTLSCSTKFSWQLFFMTLSTTRWASFILHHSPVVDWPPPPTIHAPPPLPPHHPAGSFVHRYTLSLSVSSLPQCVCEVQWQVQALYEPGRSSCWRSEVNNKTKHVSGSGSKDRPSELSQCVDVSLFLLVFVSEHDCTMSEVAAIDSPRPGLHSGKQ
jgi:hypothetical protein